MTDPKLTIQPAAAVRHLRHIARLQKAFAHEDVRKTPPEWLAADLIERQSAQIERMRAALTRAHAQVSMDRELFVRGAAAPGQPLDPDDQEIADEYIELLRQIDEAMGEAK